MKRHPKRAQHRWGPRRKFAGPPRRWTGLTLNFGPGTYVDGDVYDIAPTQPGSTTFTVRGHDITGAEIVETLTVPDGEQGVTTLAFADATIDVMGRTPPGGSVLLSFDSPGGTVEGFERAAEANDR